MTPHAYTREWAHSMCIRLMYSTYTVLHCLQRYEICGESAARCTDIGCFRCEHHDAQDRKKSTLNYTRQSHTFIVHTRTHAHSHTHSRTYPHPHTFFTCCITHTHTQTHTHTHTYVHAYTHTHAHAHLLSLLHLNHVRLSLCLGYKFSTVSITAILYT